ncbi:MAG: hydantoinase B/oxoprolinase family protein [Thermoanaerobacter sp.]|nr:hydantoinase B/oxoprolinase family protein [Thermoanaerobacter sp.]
MPVERLEGNKERYYCTLSHETVPEVDPVLLEIVKNRLFAIANEMGAAVHSTAHTPIFAETKDFSCAVFDHEGHMVGMGEFLPGHQGAMQYHLEALIDTVGWENIHEGDVFMSNDALYGGGHTPDLSLFHPVYFQGELIGFAGCVVHHLDMGGIAPISISPRATELYQEGVRFPPTTKLFEGGKLREDILNIFLTNVRMPEPQRGDLMAQVHGVKVGAVRLQELAARYGVKTLKNIYIALHHYAEAKVRSLIAAMPDGVYEGEDFVDGDGQTDKSYRVKCAMIVRGDRLTFDFSGTDPQAKGFINSRWGNVVAHSYSALMAMLPDCPKCYGSMVPMDLITERGSLLNCNPGAAIGACSTETGHLVHNLVWYCLSLANPDLGSGVWAGAWGFQFMFGTDPRTGKPFIALLQSAGGGGGGGRKTLDGWPTACQKCSNVTMPNIEIEEQYWPLLYRYRRICKDENFPGSGAGRRRGGMGVEYEVSPVGTVVECTSLCTKFYTPVHGVFGGRGGHPARAELRDARTGKTIKILPSKFQGEKITPDQTIYWAMTGGGGYGSPLEREPWLVREDVIDEYITLETARNVYGVVINPATFEIDYKATEKLRQKMKAQGQVL